MINTKSPLILGFIMKITLPHGPLREAHEHIGNLQRWNKAQDRTIFKLKTKYKELKKTVKRQAEASAQFMKKVADLLSPSLASTDDETDNEEVASEPQAYFTTFPDDTVDEATAFFPDA
ncbi:hypothetical protein F2Q68_00029492 [Brassica cretica]|uniref:Uncharacterized protein n=1 Tax=Brassica cretica TaxID=69181 RepID=A0A8S9GA47_BRACR|nr:hypothetical protein F2Q68_00029492 [Brassica cretica]